MTIPTSAPEIERIPVPRNNATLAQLAAIFEDRALKAEAALESLKVENERLKAAIAWALGEKGSFPIRQENQGAYYWRTQLRRLAGPLK